MKHTWKKAAAGLLALALVVGGLPVNVGSGGLFGGTVITANAYSRDELSNLLDKVDDFLDKNIDKLYKSDPQVIRNLYKALDQAYECWRNDSATDESQINTCYNDLQTAYKTAAVAAGVMVDITNATVNLGADNTVTSITIGDTIITELSGFDITYGTDASHTATAPPTEPGTYYAYVAAKDTNENYTGTAKSSSFEIAVLPAFSSASVTLTDGFGLNFYADNITSTNVNDYKVKFSGECDEDGMEIPLTEKDGKFYATANVDAKDINKKIKAELYKGTKKVDEIEYSVYDYIYNASQISIGDSKAIAMLESTLLYGYAADEYFNNGNYNLTQIIDGVLSDLGIDVATIKDNQSYQADSDALGANKVSMVLNSKVKLRVYSDKGTEENSYGKYSEIGGLTPVTMGQNQTIDEFSVSGYTWGYRVLINDASSEKNIIMAKALYAYMKSAAALLDNTGGSGAPDSPTVQTKTVTIGDAEYVYTEGMTWAEFIETQPTSYGWYVSGDSIYDASGSPLMCIGDETFVNQSEVIDNSKTYGFIPT